jgi:hypothetical protein
MVDQDSVLLHADRSGQELKLHSVPLITTYIYYRVIHMYVCIFINMQSAVCMSVYNKYIWRGRETSRRRANVVA